MPHVTNHQNSEKKKSTSSFEKALIASEIRYRRLFESAKDGILILDAETGMIVDVNPFLIDLLGYSKKEFVEKSIWEIGIFRDIYENKEKFLELQQKEYVRYEDLPLETAEGQKINVEFVSNVYLVNNQKVIQCNIRDITERKVAEADLEKTRKELEEIKRIADEENKFTENIINTVREPLLVLDDGLRIIKASRSFYDFFKVNTEDTIGRLIYDLGNRQWNIPKLRELLEKILPKKTSFDNYEVEHDFSSIGTRIMLLNARQIKRGLGKEKIILLAFQDVTERKRRERSLSEKSRLTNEYLKILLEHAHAPIITWDASMLIKRFNPEFEKLSGYNKSEVQDKKIEILFPENEVASTLGLLKNTIGGENPEIIEINILTKDKEIKTVLWNSANISDEEGKNTVATIAQDITSRKRTEKELINSEIRYRRLFESAKDGILILNAETGVIVDVNPFLIDLLGYSKKEFVEKSIWKIGTFQDIFENKEKFLELQQNEYIRYEDLPLETANGRKIYVEFVSNVYLADKKKVIQCNIRDITKRKQDEKELIMLAHALKSINECVSITDLQDKIIFVNESFLKTYGYLENELIGKNIKIVRSQKNESKLIKKILLDTLKGGWNNELWNKRKDGSEFLIYLSTAIITDTNGNPLGLIGVASDITEQKRFEQDLMHAKNRAEESDRLKSSFLANMSHEIRTPMNGILGFTELLKEPLLSGEQQQEFIGIIEKSGVRMLNIINDIINISKIESEEIEMIVSYINVNDEIKDIYNFFKPEAEQKKLHFSFNCTLQADQAVIKTDKEKVYAVISNLVKNALKFTKTGSIELGYEKKGKFLEFFVKDTGLGIQKKQEEFIFERFRQGNESLTRNFEGAGLGLAISKSYVEMLGGKIWIERIKGQGSTFRFTIPYLNGIKKKEQFKAATDAKILPIRKLKILLVEDDKTSIRLLEIMIKPLEDEIFQAISGHEAVEVCRNNPDLDLVLMDIQMPGMNGYEATHQIREFNKEVIIIAQTAFALNGDREKAMAAGCNDYISKPVNRVILTKMIKKHLQPENV